MELVFELGWKSVIAAGLTLLALQLVKRRSAAERSWIAHAGLIAMLLLPVAAINGPNWQVEALPSDTQGVAVKTVGAPPSVQPIFGGEAEPVARASAQPGFEPNVPGTEQVLLWLYLVPAGLLALLLVVAVFRLFRLRGRSEVLVDPQWATALAAAQRRMGFKHGTALLVSEELRSPISWGVVRPVILLDRRAAADAAQAEAIIAHELAHVARLDWAMLLLARLATAIYWFNPLVWMLARRAHELAEQAVDDSVLRHDINGADYAQLLIGSARHNNAAVLLAANGVAGSGSLTSRVERVLDPSHSRESARWTWLAGTTAAILLVAAPLSAFSPIRQGSAPRSSSNYSDVGEVDVRALSALSVAQGEMERGGAKPNAAASPEAARTSMAIAKVPAAFGTPSMAPSAGASAEGALGSTRSLEGQKFRSDQSGPDDARAAVDVPANAPVIRDARPLLTAAWYGRLEMVKLLLDAGADINATTGRGEGNALMTAARRGNLQLVEYLLSRGANINAAVPGAGNALLQASHGGHEDVVRYLIARGANVHRINKDESPLASAVYAGHPNIVKLLIAAGAGRESR